MKKFLFSFLTLMCLIFSIGVISSQAEMLTGECGEMVTYSLDTDTGVMTISGEGAMDNCGWASAPWYYNRNYIKEVVIEEGVTTVGKYAFMKCAQLTKVTMPEGLINIKDSAFYYCSNLAEADIPTSVKTIEIGAFNGCGALTKIIIPDNVEEIGNSAFSGCMKVTTLYLGNKVNRIEDFAFGSLAVDKITIPDSVTFVGSEAFGGCTNLKEVTIGEGVEYLGSGAFNSSRSLEKITWKAKNAGDFYSGSTVFNTDKKVSITFTDNVEKIPAYCFESILGIWINDITIGKNVKEIGSSAFKNGRVTTVNIADLGAWCEIDFGDENSNPIKSATMFYVDGKVVENLVVPDGVKKIGAYAFYCATALKNAVIPDSVESIGNYAFAFCKGLTDITLGENVSAIGDFAFDGCEVLESITAYDNILKVGTEAIHDTPYFKNLMSAKKPVYLGKCLISIRPDVIGTDLAIEKGTKAIASSAFQNFSSIQNITIPDSVEYVGNRAFSYCSGVKTLTIGTGLKEVDEFGFESCGKAITLNYNGTISDWAKIEFGNHTANPAHNTIGSWTSGKFYVNGSEVMGDIVIEEGVEKIGNYTFYNLKNITGVTLPDSLKTVGEYAFYACNGMTKLDLGSGVEVIDDNAFENCGRLSSVTIPDSVYEIAIYAFKGCSNLTEVRLGKGVEDIQSFAFNSCSKLADVYYAGSRGMWRNVSVGTPNDSLENATMHYGIEMPGEIEVEVTQTWYNSVTIESKEIKEENKVVALKLVDGQYISQEVDITEGSGEVYCDGAESVKIFIWESYETMRPLSEVIEFKFSTEY